MSKINDEESSYDDILNSLQHVELEQKNSESNDTKNQPDGLEEESGATRDIGAYAQQLNLPDPQNRARFEVTDIDWPTEDLTPSICLWHQDKVAAVSISIDDNHVRDHPFWLELAGAYNWKWTWFVITNQIGIGDDDWQQWQNLANLGHDIQSHTCSHLCDGLFNIRREYQQSQVLLNNKLDLNKAVTLAYPFGFKTRKNGSPCASIPTKNSRQEAARRYIAARDVVGTLLNPAKMDFMKVPSISKMRNFFCADCNWAYFDSVLDANSRNYRTWYSAHFHHITDPQLQSEIRRAFNHIHSKEKSIWVGKFADVAKYAQEYATASVHNLRATETQMTFDLHDEMNDQYYDFPLSIKIRLPNAWGDRIAATQNNQMIDTKFLRHGGKNYILVYAIPDRGRVALRRL